MTRLTVQEYWLIENREKKNNQWNDSRPFLLFFYWKAAVLSCYFFPVVIKWKWSFFLAWHQKFFVLIFLDWTVSFSFLTCHPIHHYCKDVGKNVRGCLRSLNFLYCFSVRWWRLVCFCALLKNWTIFFSFATLFIAEWYKSSKFSLWRRRTDNAKTHFSKCQLITSY